MNQDILISKIVPNPTDTTWAQAYTTLNVYITLSIESSETKKSVASQGKELLEKLQREFFALDDKSLENIKKAVENVSTTITEDYKYSILVGSIVQGVLYIVIASGGQVIIKRAGKTGIIATGIPNELHGFSGKLMHDDIIIFETSDFAEKISLAELSPQLTTSDVSQITENITPLVHGESKGTESAIVLHYNDIGANSVTPTPSEDSDQELEEVPADELNISQENEKEIQETTYEEENLWTKTREDRSIESLGEEDQIHEDQNPKENRPFITLPTFNFVNKRIIIIGAVAVLVIVLVGGVLFQINKQNSDKKLAEFNTIYLPIKNKFDEGVNLISLNKTLALEDLTQTQQLINENLDKFPENSEEHKKLLDLKSQIESKISELGGGGSATNITEFLKPTGDIKSITAISAKGGNLAILDSDGEQVATVTTEGKIQKTYDIEDKAKYITTDEKFIYTLGDTITQVDLGNGNVEVLTEEPTGSSIQSFGSNVYTFTGSDVLKYRAPSYTESSYFTEEPTLKASITDMAISGPVWLLEKNGSVERFTKGINDDIELSGLTGAIGEGAKIYADADLDNVYILDVKNQRVVVIDEEGAFQRQYEGSFMKNANSFAIDEENSVGYVVSKNIVYSFEL